MHGRGKSRQPAGETRREWGGRVWKDTLGRQSPGQEMEHGPHNDSA